MLASNVVFLILSLHLIFRDKYGLNNSGWLQSRYSEPGIESFRDSGSEYPTIQILLNRGDDGEEKKAVELTSLRPLENGWTFRRSGARKMANIAPVNIRPDSAVVVMMCDGRDVADLVGRLHQQVQRRRRRTRVLVRSDGRIGQQETFRERAWTGLDSTIKFDDDDGSKTCCEVGFLEECGNNISSDILPNLCREIRTNRTKTITPIFPAPKKCRYLPPVTYRVPFGTREARTEICLLCQTSVG
ncbi:hypothetical protein IW262DRAFT_1301666 [Armillaria fumosa]|nr:hypothetical protein IW262DRAFT_1301658 [Armillaria fumosa]KAK0211744.1 hypothetical protein IW262DRAFT_1301662 [Armillaria fumosa]KAK0211748.1 hypothetical protein IW262DRAFT_1301666 [Armillaria fumosa]